MAKDIVTQIQEIDEDKFKDNHKFLGEGLMMPFINHTNSNRAQMFNSHIVQAIQTISNEIPLVGTGFENQVLKHSVLGYEKLDGKWMVLKKIVKNQYSYILIVQNYETREYDMITRHHAINLTEQFGIEYNNSNIDSLCEGDIVEDQLLYHDNNYDPDLNAQVGVNLNAAYLSYKG